MAPEAGLEPATRRLIPTGRDSIIDQLISNPLGRFHAFDLPLPKHRRSSGRVLLAPDQFPGTIFARELAAHFIGAIVRAQANREIIGVADVEFSGGVLKNIGPIHIPSIFFPKMAPEAGLEPATRRLTAGCSTIELLWNSDPWFCPTRLIPIFPGPTEGRNLLECLCLVKRI